MTWEPTCSIRMCPPVRSFEQADVTLSRQGFQYQTRESSSTSDMFFLSKTPRHTDTPPPSRARGGGHLGMTPLYCTQHCQYDAFSTPSYQLRDMKHRCLNSSHGGGGVAFLFSSSEQNGAGGGMQAVVTFKACRMCFIAFRPCSRQFGMA